MRYKKSWHIKRANIVLYRLRWYIKREILPCLHSIANIVESLRYAVFNWGREGFFLSGGFLPWVLRPKAVAYFVRFLLPKVAPQVGGFYLEPLLYGPRTSGVLTWGYCPGLCPGFLPLCQRSWHKGENVMVYQHSKAVFIWASPRVWGFYLHLGTLLRL